MRIRSFLPCCLSVLHRHVFMHASCICAAYLISVLVISLPVYRLRAACLRNKAFQVTTLSPPRGLASTENLRLLNQQQQQLRRADVDGLHKNQRKRLHSDQTASCPDGRRRTPNPNRKHFLRQHHRHTLCHTHHAVQTSPPFMFSHACMPFTYPTCSRVATGFTDQRHHLPCDARETILQRTAADDNNTLVTLGAAAVVPSSIFG